MPDGIEENELQDILSDLELNVDDVEEEVEEEAEGSEEDPEEDPAEDDEDPDNVEDDDPDSPEDEDEESEEDEDDEVEEDPAEIEDDATVRLADGTEVTGKELREGYLRQQDYTKKTQEVADARRQVQDIYQKMSEWYEQRANAPEAWVAEIVGGADDPAEVLAGALLQTGEATIVFSQVVKHLVQSGELPDELIEAMGLQELAKQAKQDSVHLQVKRLEKQIQQQSQTASQQAAIAQAEAEINRQWSVLVAREGLTFSSSEEEFTEKVELLKLARSKGLVNLDDAWAVKSYLAGTKAAPKAPKKTSKAKAEQVVKKRKTAAMSRKPTGGSGPSKKQSASDDLIGSAVSAALSEMDLDL